MNVSQLRLRNPYIEGSRLEDPAEVVRALGAVQAHDYYAALWAIGLRLFHARESDVEQAIIEWCIVRTWPMRGTLHFDRTAALEPLHAKRAAAGHGIFRAPVVIDGRIVGSWTRELKKDRVERRLTPLTRFHREHLRYINDAAQRYGEFLGLPAKVNKSA